MPAQRRLFSLVAVPLIFGSSIAMAAEGGAGGIGFYTAVLGQVSVIHPTKAQVLPVKLHDEVLFKDVIQTQHESRARAFFQDDSMLTVGENSRVEIDEFIYNPDVNVRQTIVKLMQGQVRALVSKVFKANGSRFEIHTPSAVAAARGTYFTVWVENGQSGIINIGEKGRVDFTSGGITVAVDPGYFSIAHEGQAPSVPLPHHLEATVKTAEEKVALTQVTIHGQSPKVIRPIEKSELTPVSAPAGLTRALVAVERTTLREPPLVELPAQTLQALGFDARLINALTTLTSQSTGSLGSTVGGTVAAVTGTLTTGNLAAGAASIGTTTNSGGTTSVGTLSVGSVSVGSTVVAPLAPVVSPVVAPLAPVVSTVVAPVASLVSTVVAPVTPLISTVVAPIAPVIAPVVAPVTPLVTTILATPPAVINGALGLLTP
jgi:FecR protein